MTRSPIPYDTKIDSRGRLWVNKAIRDHIGLPHGGRAQWFINEDGDLALRAANNESKDG